MYAFIGGAAIKLRNVSYFSFQCFALECITFQLHVLNLMAVTEDRGN